MLELNQLYNMDCMAGMAEFPDGYFELAIVDPPYGVGSITYMPHKRTKAFGGAFDEYNITIAVLDVAQRSGIKNKYLTTVTRKDLTQDVMQHFGDENIAPPPEYFKELFRVSKNQIIWGGNNFLLPPSRNFLVWRKLNIPEGFSMAMCEYAWVSINGNAKYVELNPQSASTGEKRIHPTQKPTALYEWILRHYAKPGDKILDTHAGSASSLVACHRGGFEFIGFELDADYYRVAKERIDAERAQMMLT